MASYINFSVTENSKVPMLTRESMKTINTLDEIVTSVSLQLDEEIIKTSKKKQKIDSNSKVSTLKCIVEELAERKTMLVVKAYDMIDHQIKCVDEEIKLIEKAMMLNGHSIPSSTELDVIKSSEVEWIPMLVLLR